MNKTLSFWRLLTMATVMAAILSVPSVMAQGGLSEDQVRAIIEDEMAGIAEDESILDRMQIHGSVSQGFLVSNNNNWMGNTEDGHFNFNEFTINFSTDITDKLRAGIQIMSRDIGNNVNNRVTIDWAMLDYSVVDEFGVRAGILRVPVGLYNESRDIDMARIGVFLPQGMYPENGREVMNNVLGFGVYGSLNLSEAGNLDYLAVFGDQNLDKEGETATQAVNYGVVDPGMVKEVGTSRVAALRVNWATPVGLKLNGSYYRSRMSLKGTMSGLPVIMDTNPITNWTVGAEYTLNNLVVAGEYRQGDADADLYVAGMLASSSYMPRDGWHITGSYRFCNYFATEVSYSESYPDMDDRDGDIYSGEPGDEKFWAWSKAWSFNGRFDINSYWIFKAGLNYVDGTESLSRFENISGVEQDWILFQLKTSVSF